jgi:hypothetical protein
MRLRAALLSGLWLASITSDKVVYRQGRDVVHLLGIHGRAAGREQALVVRLGTTEFARRVVRLDAAGCAALSLTDLPQGEYEARWADDPAEEPGCDFTVAEFKLAPLVAMLVRRSLVGDPPQLAFTLRLEAFGVPVHGPIRLELTDRSARLAECRAEARHGEVQSTFVLTGEGPHAINVQMIGDPSRTATVPILGSRKAERSPTVFSRLGRVVLGSLLPGEESSPVRGLYLDEEGVETSPFHLERVDCEVAWVRAVTDIDRLHILVISPSAANPARESPAWSFAAEGIRSGQAFEIPTPGPLAFLAIGAFVRQRPWEGWAAVVAPQRLSPRIHVPARTAPGEELTLDVETGGRQAATVYVVVKDARLLSSDRPGNRLAGQIKKAVERARMGNDEPAALHPVVESLIPVPTPPTRFPRGRSGGLWDLVEDFLGGLSEQAGSRRFSSFMGPSQPVDTGSLFLRAAQALTSPAGAMEEVAVAEDRSADDEDQATGLDLAASGPPADRSRPGSSVRETEPEREEAGVLFAGFVPVEEGRARLTLTLGPAFADYLVEALVTTGQDWAEADARFQAAKDLYAELQLPLAVHPKDGARGQLCAGVASGRMRVRVTADGRDLPLLLDGMPLEPGEVLEMRRATLGFLAGAGDYQAEVEDVASGEVVRNAGRVAVPGKFRRLTRTIRFLQPGESISIGDDPSIQELRVLPGLDRPFRVLVQATADYGHACCEQTAAKLLATSLLYAMSGADPRRRGEAESIFLAGVRRVAGMWLPGRGFKMYPESPDQPDSYFGPKTARYLHYLELVRDFDGGPGPDLRQAIEEGLRMARDTMASYHLAWPPSDPRHCEDAYAAVRFAPNGPARALGLQFTRSWQPETNGGDRKGGLWGAVAFRSDAAYVAAALFRGGSPADYPRALALANRVVADLGEEGRLYSTVDSVAAIALLAEMQAARIVGGTGRVRVNRRAMATQDAQAIESTRSVKSLEGTVVVEVTRWLEEDWETFAPEVPLRVQLVKGGKPRRKFAVADGLDLVIRLTKGYQAGDLAWICLPDALSRVVGGGQVKQFAVDFRGRDELRIPLAATAVTVGPRGQPAPQHFAVCIRNMFIQERTGNPGLLSGPFHK